MNEPDLWDQPEQKWLPFEKAREIARRFKVFYPEEWEALVKDELENMVPFPDDVPPDPERIYRYSGWKGWEDWLVPPDDRKDYSTFYPAREFARSLRLKTKNDWMEYTGQKEPLHLKYNVLLPGKPWLEYKNKGWKGWADWLGTNVQFKDFKTTRKFIRSKKFKTIKDWKDYCNVKSSKHGKKAQNIYTFPDIAFKNSGWQGWDDWFGISLFNKNAKEKLSDLPERAKHCRCKGLIYTCDVCDGKGYYF
jgi:hypothetical protein